MNTAPRFTLIFDFDGTIADTLEHARLVGNALAPHFGLTPVSLEEFEILRNLTVLEIQKKLKLASWKIPFLLFFFRRKMLQCLPDLRCVEMMPETLKRLNSLNVDLGIVTSNHLTNVTAFLDNHGLRSSFQFVDGGARILGKGRRLRWILKRYDLKAQEVFYVGDEMRDVLAARQAGVRSIAVSWGFNTPEALATVQPHFLIDHPWQLWEISMETMGVGEP